MIKQLQMCFTMLMDHNMHSSTALPEDMGMDLINHPIWFWLFLLQCIVIVILVFLLVEQKINARLAVYERNRMQEYGKKEVDLVNVMKSINSSKELYKELSLKCHPDRYAGDPRQAIARELFRDISANKRNYQKLREIQEVANKKLV